MTTFMMSTSAGSATTRLLLGVLLGLFTFSLFFGIDLLIKKSKIRMFTTAIIGLFVGYLLGQALVVLFNSLLSMTSMGIAMQPQTIDIFKIVIFLFGTYLGTVMTLRFSEELHLSIPFVHLKTKKETKRSLVLDMSILEDPRLIDLASTGLLDESLIIPRFLHKELSSRLDSSDELVKTKARKGLDTIKKLESIPHLKLSFTDADFPEVLEINSKVLHLARSLKSHVLSSEMTRLDTTSDDDVLIVNLNSLANILKPLMQAGEQLKIKVQRYGKEARQGVGYLEDGTMVVINGGGDYIGETIDTHVLSIKHTSSGRMIFCNVKEDEIDSREYVQDRY